MSDKTKVTSHQPFYTYDEVPVFAVNANLLLYINHLAAADAFMDKAMESALIQHLSDTANALMKACGHSSETEGQGHL